RLDREVERRRAVDRFDRNILDRRRPAVVQPKMHSRLKLLGGNPVAHLFDPERVSSRRTYALARRRDAHETERRLSMDLSHTTDETLPRRDVVRPDLVSGCEPVDRARTVRREHQGALGETRQA